MSHDMQIVSAGAARSSAMAQNPHPIPLPDCRERGLSIRPGTMDDLPFLDSLQKLHTKQVGWMPTKQFEGYINMGAVLVAEGKAEDRGSRIEDSAEASRSSALSSTLYPLSSPAQASPAQALGYIIARDRYFKRDDVGIVYQLNVAKVQQRKLIGATLLKAVFDRAAYGCRLFCCWCAQDIEANRFWEAMGFVPLAFRAGSEKKVKGGRVHIFWQRRIRAGDATTPWWFPAKTDAGALREDRLVLPIPPGLHWSDEMPRIPANAASQPAMEDQRGAGCAGGAGGAGKARRAKAALDCSPPTKHGARQFGAPPAVTPAPPAPQAALEKPKPQKKPKVKADPKLVAAARELRDRYLEQVNTTPLLPAGKYDVARPIAQATSITPAAPKQLPQAA